LLLRLAYGHYSGHRAQPVGKLASQFCFALGILLLETANRRPVRRQTLLTASA